MNTFQVVAVTALGLLAARELWRSATDRPLARMLRVFAFVAAAVAVCVPAAIQDVATALGIGRGADVVLYGFALAFLAAAVSQYGWNVRLERQLTLLIRHLAVQDARRGPVPPAAGPPGR